ncbi:hypothetical protein GCM10010193_63790 [Kitasatospora atroaurantiaca]|uniref:Mannosyltransferase n=1 Tax=Kitasatospora atroaurantiaca TaxID=285545 RepID=A0A561EU15_9ACTN|nr:glycosyltransferase family 39 protein [Kitasatospora atroaurantiaca]TWE19112.1 mannosyltransferase [Kitasatospora atroaurantiaca]
MSYSLPRSLARSAWLWPALAALVVGLFRIRRPELWRDEVSSWSAATRSLGDLFGMLGNVDASNGAYYVLLHVWTTALGDSVLSLRLPSALAMAGAAAFAALTAQRLFDSRVAGLGAGLLLATVPTISRYAQEARAYAAVTCAVAAATWFLLRALDRPGIRRWAWYCLAMAVAATLHLVSLSSLGGQLVLVAAHWRGGRGQRRAENRRVLWQFPLAVLVFMAPAVPVMLLGQQQSGRQLGWILTPSQRDLRFFWQGLFGSYHVLYAFLALAALALLWPGRRWAAFQLLLVASVPVVGVWLVSQGHTSYFLDRYLLFTLPAWASLSGGGIGALHAALRRAVPRRLAVVLAVALVAVPALLGLSEQQQLRDVTAHTGTDYRGAAELAAAGYRAGDGVVAVAGWEAWMMVGPAVAYYLPEDVRPRPLFIERTAAQADDLYPVECPVPLRCIGDETRVWVVTIGTGDDPYQSLPAGQAAALRAVFIPTEVRHVRGLTVSLLVRRHP